ncbi:MAG: biopolymer transporter ExbD [Gammaproteobacteria bacterium]|nr:biopolymer transporter ExbD [Gammaproteobacteria bacterium]MDH5801305.1 biopolymer transporter ExbD [Gammaproteobacteria bacterium]
MNLKQSKQEELDVNITPLIDVVFLLLIFFMVSTTFERQSEIEVVLPKAAIDAPQKETFVMEIVINAEGTYFINGKRVINTQIDTLKKAMLKVANGREDPPIIVSADANTTHQSVVTVMDAARQLGFVHLSFATTQTTSSQ